MSAFKHRKLNADRLDTNRLISMISNRQSLSPTAHAALKAALLHARAHDHGQGESSAAALSGPSFNALVAEMITARKGS